MPQFPGFSRMDLVFSGLSSAGKSDVKIPGLSRIFKDAMGPAKSEYVQVTYFTLLERGADKLLSQICFYWSIILRQSFYVRYSFFY